MDQQGSPAYCSLKWLSENDDSKVNSVDQLDANKLMAFVLLYVFNIGFPASLFFFLILQRGGAIQGRVCYQWGLTPSSFIKDKWLMNEWRRCLWNRPR